MMENLLLEIHCFQMLKRCGELAMSKVLAQGMVMIALVGF
jgi:hypothetical protein